MPSTHTKLKGAEFVRIKAVSYFSWSSLQLTTVCLLAFTVAALAQLPSPNLDIIAPSGGKAGTSFTVNLTGLDLDDPSLRFTHKGISATPVILAADKIWPEPRQDRNKFTITIRSDVPAGIYEVRVAGRYGISNPRMFSVSALSAPNELVQGSGNESAEKGIPIELDQVVNGTTSANAADFYKLTAKKGQRILVHCWADRIDSQMDPSISITDLEGNELASATNTIGRDPVADFTAPSDGEFLVKIYDFLFLGTAKHFYRLTATTRPHIDSVFPPVGLPGSTSRFTISGRNLPNGKPTQEVEISIPSHSEPIQLSGLRPMQQLVDGFNYQLEGSNTVRIGFSRAAVIQEDSMKEEEVVGLPAEFAGRFNYDGDVDAVRFSAKKGQSLWIEVTADRLTAPVDANLMVQQITTSAEGNETSRVIKEADDFVIRPSIIGFDVRTFDGGLLFTAPADSDYRVIISNNFGSSGPGHTYALAIREPKPSFQLIAIGDAPFQEARNAYPGAPRLGPGGTAAIRVVALRLDGYDGPIELRASGLPEGVTASNAQIWQGNTESRLILTAGVDAKPWIGEVRIEGTAKIGESEIKRDAVGGTLNWKATDYTRERIRSRLSATIPLQVSAEKPLLTLAPMEEKTWEVEIQKQLELPIALTKAEGLKGNVTITPYGLPNFRRPQTVNIAEKDKEGALKVSFRVDGNNKPIVSEGRFILLANGLKSKYSTNPEAVEKWKGWQKAVGENGKKLVAEKATADAALRSAEAALAIVKKNVTTASPDAKAGLEKSAAEAQASVDERKKVAAEAANWVKKVDLAKKLAAAELKKATDRAKAKDLKFMVFSRPIDLKITPPPEKKK